MFKNISSSAKVFFSCLGIMALMMYSTSTISTIYAQGTTNIFPMYRHNLQRTGRVPFAGPSNNDIKWSISTSGEIWSSPVIDADGVIYVGGTDGNLLSVTPNGKVLWAYKVSDEIFGSPTIGLEGVVYFGSVDGRLYAISPDGKLKWKFQTKGAVHTSPAIDSKGIVYFGSYDGKLYALGANGKLLWNYQTGAEIFTSSPAIGTDNTIYMH